jgi:hypothetical protein
MKSYGQVATASGIGICDAKRSTSPSSTASKLLSYGITAILLTLLSGLMASAQTATTALAGLTPQQLHDGTATFMGHYNSNQKLRLVIGLQHPHMAEEEQFLKELHTKSSPNFQKFLTADEWNARFAPSAADEQAVVDWATSQGLTVTKRFANRLLVDVEAPAGTIEKVFGVTMNGYQVGTRAAFSNDRDPVIPASLGNIIHSIGGLNSVQVYRPTNKAMKEPAFADYSEGPTAAVAGTGAADAKAKRPAKGLGVKPNITGGAYDPTDIYGSPAYDVNALYAEGHCCNPLGNSGITPSESSIAIATAGTQAGSDLAGFQSSYPYLAYHYQQFYIDGTPSCCDGEGTLDFDWSTAWSNSFGGYQNTAMIYLYDGVNNQFSTFTDVYNQILSDAKAKVFSTSWGCEELYCTPQSVMDTDHGIFNSMAGQGFTMVAATGDQGATAGCGDAVAVQYPASDPNIVGAGGATLLLNYDSSFYSESAWSGGPYGCGSNDGGSTGGVSAYYAAPGYQTNTGYSNRTVPDIALNADWYNSPQNFYYDGYLQGNGGTSIVAPSVAGFFAQANAYLDYISTQTGGCYPNASNACTPLGNGNNYLYFFGNDPSYPSHYPYYDVTTGCNNNDITAEYGLGYYCAGTGYDEVTGWGTFNALQLSWAINTYKAGDFVPPSATFTGPTTNVWYNTDQEVSWTVADAGQSGLPATGVAGFTQTWDTTPPDSTTAPSPRGGSDGFYTGPEYPNSTFGYQYVSWAGQGCHTTYVRSYDNSGWNQVQTYGPVCYDTVAPVTSASLIGTYSSGVYISNVNVTLSATDASSGVKHTYYSLDGSGYNTYSAPFTVSALGNHTLNYYSTDVAGNTESTHTLSFTIQSATSTSVSSSSNPAPYGAPVAFTATVTPVSGAGATGTVAFYDGTTFLGNGTISSGKAKYTASALAAGSHSITAVYQGSTTDQGSTSSTLSELVYGPPATVSVSPSSGDGLTQTFTAVYSDPAGTSDLNNVRMLINTAINGTNACYVYYYPATNALYLENNGNTGTLGPLTPGSSSSLSNSQCTLAGTGSSASASGNNLTVHFALTFASAFTESKNVYLEGNNAYAGSGWSQKGSWTPVSVGAPTVTSLAPASGTGLTQTFGTAYSDPNGYEDLSNVRVLINSTLSGVNGCYVYYYPATNAMYLENNAGTGTLGPITPGSSSTLSNSQCTLNGAGSSATGSGNTLKVYFAITFANTYAGLKNIYIDATAENGAISGGGFAAKGTWTPVSLGPPTVVSLSPGSGTGLTQTFSATYSDPNGLSDLNNVRLLMNPSINGVNACYVYYYPGNNGLYLENNADNAVVGPITPGSSSTASNSQCTLSAAASSVTKSGNNITVNFAITFSSTYTGSKNIYLESNSAGASSGWVAKGSWTP